MKFKLRPWSIEDLESISKHADNPKIINRMSDAFPDSCEKWKSFLEFATKDTERLYLAIEINGEAAGGIGISPEKDVLRKNAELGYWLSESYWGNGIIPKAISEIVNLAFNRFDIERVWAAPFGSNTASHRALEKASFKLEARFEKIVFKNNEMLDELVYAIRKESAVKKRPPA